MELAIGLRSFRTIQIDQSVMDWGIEDPKGKWIEKVREIRDVIEQKVRRLAADLVKDNPEINF